MDLLDCIWSGECYKDDSHLKILHSLYQSNFEYYMGQDASMDKPFQDCRTDLERIEMMRKFFVWTPVPSQYLERFQKSENTSDYFSQLAEESVKIHKYKDALREFNLAIAFSPTGSPAISVALLERAKFFTKRKHFQLAIRDIKIARDNGCSENILKDLEAQIKAKPYIPRNSDDEHSSSRIRTEQKFFQLSSSNPKLENAESFVEIESTPDRGRRLVVTRNVNAGEKLVIQQPFMAVLRKYLYWDMGHCHFCFKPILGGVPCRSCTFSMYCTEECRNRSLNSGHQHEHNLLPYLHSCKAPLRDLVALRIICKLGPQELFRLFQTQSESLNAITRNGNILGCNQNGVYESSTYLPIYHLVSHPDHLRPLERVSNCFRALVLIHLLEETSEFFAKFSESLPPKLYEEFKNFVASLILHHIENIPYNAISVSKLKTPGQNGTRSKTLDPTELDSESYALAVFSLLSICNHSCDPNAVPLRRSYSPTVSLIAMKSMKARDEILISYAPLFTSMPTAERRNFLNQRYNFTCDCPACNNNWFMNVTETVNNFLHGINSTSSSSGRKSRKREQKSEIMKLKSNLESINDIICEGNYIEGIETLKPFLVSLTRNYSSQFPLTLYAQELLKRALVLLVNQ